MKRTILVTLALASLISCSQEETINSPLHEAIAFDNAFVENSTRAAYDGSYTTNSLTKFQVYGTITNKNRETGNIFDNVDVTKCGVVWGYSVGLQYWIPGNDYNFAATVHGNEVKTADNAVKAISTEVDDFHMPTSIKVTDMSVQKDILYAVNGPIVANATTWGETVSFIFHHLLSKVKFTVWNNIPTQNGYLYKIENITILDAANNGKYIIGNGWDAAATTDFSFSPDFGHAVNVEVPTSEPIEEGTLIAVGDKYETQYERLLLPAKQSFTIQFDYYLYNGTQLIDALEDKTITSQEMTLEAGKAYNFNIKLSNPGEPITFDVSKIEDWDTDLNNNKNDDDDTEIK